MRTARKYPTLALAALAATCSLGTAWGQDFTFSMDAPADLQGTVYTVNQTVAHAAGTYGLSFDGASNGLDESVNIDALALLPGTGFVFSSSTPFTVAGTTFLPRDVVRFAGGSYSIYLNGAAAGLPESANIDAVAFDPVGALLLSFEVPEQVGNTTYAPNDLARVTGSTLSLALSGAAIGLGPDVNVVGYEPDPNGGDLFRFDVPVELGAVSIGRGDIARRVGNAWSVHFRDPAFPEDVGGQDFSLDCVAPPYLGALHAAKTPGPTQLSWSPGGAGRFDLVRGDLLVLRASVGDFEQALNAIAPSSDVCMANDTPLLSVNDLRPDPTPGRGYFYVLRPVAGCGAAGTYDSGGAGQVGSRDAEIAAALGDCP